ncbi:SRPBCC family protein [Nocardioides sp. GXQ0305]|uniref:SRPBCC family protein n=1 Tax=Nocardioides sp. GXQ0305 TaxID=3423912 RepID=UPI003D7E8BD3
MELQHRFTVPAGVEETWAHFSDIEGVAGCFPGATVTEADTESFSGTVKVKLGPIALVYNGSGTFVEKDEAGHRMVIDAKGKDKRGNGTAGAVVTATMTEASPGSTDVEVSTDLSITGKAAQFGRGNVIKDVSDKLLGQFVACLEQRLGADTETGAAPAEPAATPDPAAATERATETPAEAPAPEPQAPAASAGAPAAATSPAAGPPPPAPRQPSEQDDAIDLGATVLPVLARTYWKPAVAVLVVVVAVIWWLASRD